MKLEYSFTFILHMKTEGRMESIQSSLWTNTRQGRHRLCECHINQRKLQLWINMQQCALVVQN